MQLRQRPVIPDLDKTDLIIFRGLPGIGTGADLVEYNDPPGADAGYLILYNLLIAPFNQTQLHPNTPAAAGDFPIYFPRHFRIPLHIKPEIRSLRQPQNRQPGPQKNPLQPLTGGRLTRAAYRKSRRPGPNHQHRIIKRQSGRIFRHFLNMPGYFLKIIRPFIPVDPQILRGFVSQSQQPPRQVIAAIPQFGADRRHPIIIPGIARQTLPHLGQPPIRLQQLVARLPLGIQPIIIPLKQRRHDLPDARRRIQVIQIRRHNPRSPDTANHQNPPRPNPEYAPAPAA